MFSKGLFYKREATLYWVFSMQSLFQSYNLSSPGKKSFYIDELGRDHPIDNLLVDLYAAMNTYTVKIEGLESIFTDFGGTVHLYYSPRHAASFGMHTDPYDVKIICIEGVKTMEVAGVDIELHEGEQLMIPADTPHRATNKYDSVMISIGYE